jgi:hypothetical protein
MFSVGLFEVMGIKIQELQLAFQSEIKLPSTDTLIEVLHSPNVLSLQEHLTEYVSV